MTQSPTYLIPNRPITDSSLADRLERHEETSNAELARRMGGDIWEREDVLAFSSRPELGRGLNFACRVRSDDTAIARLIDDISAWFARRGVAPHFRVSPLTRPANLASLLAARGFTRTEAETQMVLSAADVECPTNPRVSVEPVATEELIPWITIQHAGFGGQGAPSDLTVEMARTLAAMDGHTLYLARLDGEPVGAGVLAEWAGAFGIYGVAARPDARGHGVATALVRHLVRQVRPGVPLCLQVETGSATQRWYERLGFRVIYDRTGWTLEHGQI